MQQSTPFLAMLRDLLATTAATAATAAASNAAQAEKLEQLLREALLAKGLTMHTPRQPQLRQQRLQRRQRQQSSGPTTNYRLFSIAADRYACPPTEPQLANAVLALRFDSSSASTGGWRLDVAAYGAPELFACSSMELEDVLHLASSGSSGSEAAEEYRIEPILFGTACWVYCYGGVWRLATKRSPDAGSITLRPGAPTLLAAFDAALAASATQLPISISAPTSFDELCQRMDPARAYGFVLHHRQLHLYSYSDFETRVWHVSTTLVDANAAASAASAEGERSIGVARPPAISLADCEEGKAASIAELCRACASSLTPSQSNSVLDFGFVLRYIGTGASISATKHRYRPSYVVKSPLYSFIEEHIGKTMPLRAVISRLLYRPAVERDLFCRIFPSLVPSYQLALSEVDTIAQLISQRSNSEAVAAASQPKRSTKSGRSANAEARQRRRPLDELCQLLRPVTGITVGGDAGSAGSNDSRAVTRSDLLEPPRDGERVQVLVESLLMSLLPVEENGSGFIIDPSHQHAAND